MSRSSTEAKYQSIVSCVAELLWMKSLLEELHIPIIQIPARYCDNSGVVQLAANPILHARTKNVEIDLHFVRDHVIKRSISVRHIPACDQLVDLLTKSVSNELFTKFRTKFGIVSLPMLNLKGDIRVIK